MMMVAMMMVVEMMMVVVVIEKLIGDGYNEVGDDNVYIDEDDNYEAGIPASSVLEYQADYLSNRVSIQSQFPSCNNGRDDSYVDNDNDNFYDNNEDDKYNNISVWGLGDVH